MLARPAAPVYVGAAGVVLEPWTKPVVVGRTVKLDLLVVLEPVGRTAVLLLTVPGPQV